jgi:hypothetical protein
MVLCRVDIYSATAPAYAAGSRTDEYGAGTSLLGSYLVDRYGLPIAPGVLGFASNREVASASARSSDISKSLGGATSASSSYRSSDFASSDLETDTKSWPSDC